MAAKAKALLGEVLARDVCRFTRGEVDLLLTERPDIAAALGEMLDEMINGMFGGAGCAPEHQDERCVDWKSSSRGT